MIRYYCYLSKIYLSISYHNSKEIENPKAEAINQGKLFKNHLT